MLSYLKDANQLPASADMPDNDQADSNVNNYVTVSGQGQKIRQSTMILVTLFAIGALGIWFMVKKAGTTRSRSGPVKSNAKRNGYRDGFSHRTVLPV